MANEGEILVYQPNSTLRLEVKVDGTTAWLNRKQMAELFERDIKAIGKHIANALREELNPAFSNVGSFSPDATGIRQGMMLSENPVVAEFATTAADGKDMPSLKSFVERLKVKYAFQVVADTAPSSVNPFDYEGQPVNIAFADFVKVLI